MSNRVFKNYQINLGVPFQVKVPLEELFESFYNRIGDAGGDGGDGINGGNGSYGIKGGDGSYGINGGDNDDEFYAISQGRRISAFGDTKSILGLDGDSGRMQAPVDSEEILDAARAEAESLLSEARANSEDIIMSANTEALMMMEKKRSEADAYYNAKSAQAESDAARLREQARSEGEAVGREEGRAAYDALMHEAQRLRDEAIEEYAKLMDGAERDALELVLGIAKKVIGEEITHNRDSLLSIVKDAFAHCTNKDNVVLKVSPEDYDNILANRDRLLSMVEGLDKLEIKRDLSLAPGACHIETPFGNLDAGAQARFSKIEDKFYRILSETHQPAAAGSAH